MWEPRCKIEGNTMKTFSVIIGVALLLLLAVTGLATWPETSCFSQWFDSNGEKIEGPTTCPAKLQIRDLGRSKVTNVGGKVYWYLFEETKEEAGFPCMIGVACFPIPHGRRTWQTMKFTRLDGQAQFEKLQPYLDGVYFSDSRNGFWFWSRVDDADPPIEWARLHSVPCTPAAIGEPCNGYVTDGRYVLHEEKIVRGADPASFTDDVPSLEPHGGNSGKDSFGRDAMRVFYEANEIRGADPASFGILKYSSEDKYDHDLGSVIASDKSHAWRVGINEITALDVTPVQMTRIRSELAKAIATSAAAEKNR